MTHLVIVLWPDASEALAATKIIDCHMIAFVPGDDIIQNKNSVFFFVLTQSLAISIICSVTCLPFNISFFLVRIRIENYFFSLVFHPGEANSRRHALETLVFQNFQC